MSDGVLCWTDSLTQLTGNYNQAVGDYIENKISQQEQVS